MIFDVLIYKVRFLQKTEFVCRSRPALALCFLVALMIEVSSPKLGDFIVIDRKIYITPTGRS